MSWWFWIFAILALVLFFKMKNVPLFFRIGLSLAIPFILIGVFILVSWIIALLVFIFVLGVILALVFGIRFKTYGFLRKKR